MNIIKCEALTKYYGKHRGIENVNFSVEAGDFYGFIGPNGAGKSTTIRTLLGLIAPSSGKAELFGKNVTGNIKDILCDVGYLPSEMAFYRGFTVGETISFSASLRGRDCKKTSDELCERLSLDKSKKVSELSLGNKKKLGIVLALQHDPRLYILDEPTSGLDPLIQREFYDILTERCNVGATVFLSSHVLSEIGKYCKKAAVIRDGTILVSGNTRDLAHTGIKRITVRGARNIREDVNIRDLSHEDDTVRFLYSGEPRALLSHLSEMELEDFTVTEPDLEEIFMHYYSEKS